MKMNKKKINFMIYLNHKKLKSSQFKLKMMRKLKNKQIIELNLTMISKKQLK